MSRARLCLLALFLAAGCHISTSTADSGVAPVPVYGIDAGFLFGAAVNGYQVESGDDASDWNIWQSVPLTGNACTKILNCDQADQGPAFDQHYPSDLSAAAGIGLNAFRFSLEWERLAPNAPDAGPGSDGGGGYDPTALAYYHSLLDTAVDAGLTPMVTLSAGALPTWIHGLVSPLATGQSPSDWIGGWNGLPGEDAGPTSSIVQAFGGFAGDMAREFGSQVHLWVTLDLPMRHAQDAYLSDLQSAPGPGGFPPGGFDQLSSLQQAVINLAYANAAAYDAIHAVLPSDGGMPVLVGSSNLFQIYTPAPFPDADAGYQASLLLGYLGNFLLPLAFTNGDLDPFFEGTCDYTVAVPFAGCAQPGLAGRSDFIGVAYAGPMAVTPGTVFDAQGNPDLNLGGIAAPLTGFDGGTTDAPLSLPIDPGDLTSVLVAVQNAFPLVPIYVTELSLNENEMPDVQRPAYLIGAVQAVQTAMAQGVNVQGIFYRSLVDGFEWQYGFAPRTGLWSVDFTNPSRPRTETIGAQAFGAIAKAGGVNAALQSQFAP